MVFQNVDFNYAYQLLLAPLFFSYSCIPALMKQFTVYIVASFKGSKIPFISNLNKPTCASKQDILELEALQ